MLRQSRPSPPASLAEGEDDSSSSPGPSKARGGDNSGDDDSGDDGSTVQRLRLDLEKSGEAEEAKRRVRETKDHLRHI